MALFPPEFLDAVVAIGVPTEPDVSWIGTGFLYGLHQGEGQYQLFLITNKHVLNGQNNLVLRFNSREGEPAKDFPFDTKFKNGKPLWVGHKNPSIDVAAMRLNHDLLEDQGAKYTPFLSDKNSVNRKALKEVGITEGDGVFVLGFPIGMVGKKERKYTICRSGVSVRRTPPNAIACHAVVSTYR